MGQIKFHQPNSRNSFFARFVQRVAWQYRDEKSRPLDSPVRGVSLPLLLLASPAGRGISWNLSPDQPEATRETKFLDNPTKRRAKLREAVWTWFNTPLSLFLPSGPSSFPSRIVKENPLFVAGCRTSQQRFFCIASKQRRTRCHVVHATLFGESMWHPYFQFRCHSHFLSTSVHRRRNI